MRSGGYLVLAILVICVAVAVSMAVRTRGSGAGSPEVKLMDPEDILFSLPTLNDAIPPVESGAPHDPQGLVVNEDDWRQVEFTAVSDRSLVLTELEELRAFKLAHRQGVGWDAVYLRSSRPQAVYSLGIRLEELKHLLGEVGFGGLALQTKGQVVAVTGGFSAPLEHAARLYGHQHEGVVATLGVSPSPNGRELRPVQPLLQSVCDQFGMDLVDWYGGFMVVRAAR